MVQALGLGNLSWTTFYLARLENKDEVQCFDARPSFRIVGTVMRPCVSIADLKHFNTVGRLCQMPFARCRTEMDVLSDLSRAELPSELFVKPMVVEVIGAGFDRPSSADFFSLRLPRILKIHGDRCLRDAVSFDEYQRLALESMKKLREDDLFTAKAAAASVPARALSRQSSAPHLGTESSTTLELTGTKSFSSDSAADSIDGLLTHSNAVKRKLGEGPPSDTLGETKRRRLMSNLSTEVSKAKFRPRSSAPSLAALSSSPMPLRDEHLTSPMLIHESLAKAFLDPNLELFQLFSQAKVNITFNIE